MIYFIKNNLIFGTKRKDDKLAWQNDKDKLWRFPNLKISANF